MTSRLKIQAGSCWLGIGLAISLGCIAASNLSGLAIPNPRTAPRYDVIDLGLPQDNSRYKRSAAFGINDAGDVVGTADGNGVRQAFLWHRGTMMLLGALGGRDSEGWSINNRGEVVGSYSTANSVNRAFVRKDGKMRDLNSEASDRPEGTRLATAYGINDQGQIVGRSANQGFVWQEGKTTLLPTMGEARAVNERGQIVGSKETFVTEVWPLLAISWENRGSTILKPLRGHHAYPRAINNRGQIVGWSDTGSSGRNIPFPEQSGCHAVLWQSGVRDLGTLGGKSSQACAINDAGEIVGWSTISGEPTSTLFHDDQSIGSHGRKAFLYRDANMRDLNSLIPAGSGWVLLEAWGINRHGQIIGTGTHDGQMRGFVLSPVHG